LVRPDKGDFIDSKVFLPMMTGLPMVELIKCFMSLGRRHGNPLSLPITPLVDIAQIKEISKFNISNQTAIGALIPGCGSYSSNSKSLILNPKMSLTSEFIRMIGRLRGSRNNCLSACSIWLLYRCASPNV